MKKTIKYIEKNHV